MWITLEQINCLRILAETGSLSAASEALHKAKSAVSYSIQKLEDQLGFAVLDRSQYRLQLTPKGKAFLLKARPLMKELDQLKDEVGRISTGVESNLSISASAIFPSASLNSVLKSVIKKFPSTELRFHREILSGEKMLLRDKVDIGIFENLQNTIDIEGKKIARVDLKLVISREHPFLELNKKQQTLKSLSQYPHIIQRSTIEDDSIMGSPDDSIRWTVSDIDSKKDLICNSFGWGRLPDHIIEDELKNKTLVHLKHLNYDHPLDIFICRKKSQAVGPVSQFIWDAFS